ncbi:MAG: redox-sensing transcriptional repressor Rex [Candidatus Omnitrophica bacterium]|nr:redox-sensing transcriptional repressor Rex [Candidatus Omnitrophota bacterium]
MTTNKQIILRLCLYRKFMQRAKGIGLVNIYSNTIADASGVTAAQVRKDFSLLGIRGNKKAGYKLEDLLSQISDLLKKNIQNRAIIVGAGNLGKALMSYQKFAEEGIKIVALFDNNPAKVDENTSPPILPIEKMYEFIVNNKIELGAIAVPYFAAQQTFDLMILAGIKGILNFAPVFLKTPKDIFVSDVNLSLEMETVSYFINQNKEKLAE